MSQVHKRGPKTPEMNMTPLIDVTFQLIIFFMLVNNIVSEQTVDLLPPQLDDSRTRQIEEGESQLLINVAPATYNLADRKEKPLVHDGKAQFVLIGFDRFDVGDMAGMAESIKNELVKNPSVKIIIRADSAIYYDDVQLVLAAVAQAYGLLPDNVKPDRNVHLVAYMPEKGPNTVAED